MQTSTDPQADTVVVDLMEPRPLRLPKLSDVDRLLANCPTLGEALSDALMDAELRLGHLWGDQSKPHVRVRQTTVCADRSLALGCAYALFDLSMTGEYAVLEFELPTLADLLARITGGEPTLAFASELTRIEEAAFGYVCLELLSAVRRRPWVEPQLAPRLSDVTLDRHRARERLNPTARYVTVHFAKEEAAAGWGVRLIFPSTVLRAFAAEGQGTAVSTLPPVLETLLYPVQLRLGRSTLHAASINCLRTGDVVLLDGLSVRESRLSGAGTLRCGRHAWRVEVTAQGLHITHAEQVHPPGEMSVKQTGQMNTELCVDVEVELASVRLRLGELSNLRSGSVVPLHLDVNEPVLLKVANETIARASLVELEGRLGARIVELAS